MKQDLIIKPNGTESDERLRKRLIEAKESHEIALMALYSEDICALDRYAAAREDLWKAENPIILKVEQRVRENLAKMRKRQSNKAA